MTRLERAARAAAVAVGDDPDREGEPITAYIDLVRAALMDVRPAPGSVDWVVTEYFDEILNEGQP